MAFPYKEMVVEWNGSRVHVSEFEPKQPQLEPKPTVADPQGLQFARPARVEPPVLILLQTNPFETIYLSRAILISMYFHLIMIDLLEILLDLEVQTGMQMVLLMCLLLMV